MPTATKPRPAAKKTTPKRSPIRKPPKTSTTPSIPDPWDRLPDETAKEFAGFVAYRDLEPGRRSIVASVGGRPQGESSAKLRQFESVLRNAEYWSAENMWVARALQWDEYRDKMRRYEEQIAIRKMAVTHARAASVLVEKGLKKLEALDLDEILPGDVVRFISEGAKLERIARGEPEDLSEFRQGQSPQQAMRELLSSDPDVAVAAAELAAAMRKAERERERREASR